MSDKNYAQRITKREYTFLRKYKSKSFKIVDYIKFNDCKVDMELFDSLSFLRRDPLMYIDDDFHDNRISLKNIGVEIKEFAYNKVETERMLNNFANGNYMLSRYGLLLVENYEYKYLHEQRDIKKTRSMIINWIVSILAVTMTLFSLYQFALINNLKFWFM
ncbi:hypothetical protein KQ51_00951 [Candidatus Izimaplasma bacterium HR1]|uniref:hypothetical protein n=1 Tax=Candidatus Izimoplasma sp. HR1 TaxID=1541959 RepID=UPI0004F758E3|nr:hypothetical protein KQ51_00949 [Candidatus Izimaplasma bacterium HR1]AIO18830.1 hypothetical protein KQ51_00951 [Candidatus Izimaplasma bacterium HR1]